MKTKLTVLMILLLAMPMGYAYAWGGSDNADRLSQGSSNTFSPGYINAAKQQAYNVINQNNQPKSWWDSLVDKVKNKTSNNIEVAENAKVTADLKMKKSAIQSAANSQGQVITIPSDSANPDSISAYIRNKVQEYIASSAGGLSGSYEIRSSGEKYYVIWASGRNSSIKSQMFNSDGKALYATPIGITGNGLSNDSNIVNVSILGNGDVAIFWSERDSNWNRSIKARTFDSNMNSLNNTLLWTEGNGLSFDAEIQNVSILANGNIALLWTESYSNRASRAFRLQYSLKAQILDSSLNSLNNTPISITGHELLNERTLNDISILDNGNVAIFWNSYDLNNNRCLKAQILDAYGNSLYATPITVTGDRKSGSARIENISTLENGNVVIFWGEYDSNWKRSIKAQIFDLSGNSIFHTPISITGDELLNDVNLQSVSILSNGNMAVLCGEYDANWNYSVKIQIINSDGNTLYSTPIGITGMTQPILNISVLDDGNMAVFWSEYDSTWNYFCKAQILDASGHSLLDTPISIVSDGSSQVGRIQNVSILDDGNIAIFWNEWDDNSNYYLKTQIVSPDGNFIPSSILKPPPLTDTSLVDTGSDLFRDPYISSFIPSSIDDSPYNFELNSFIENEDVVDIFKSLLEGKSLASGILEIPTYPDMTNKLLKGSLVESTLTMPKEYINIDNMRIVEALASILKNPTEDQKTILDVIEGLLADMKNLEKKAGKNPELSKAENDLLQMAAAVLLAQGVPDLLKAGDIEGIKGIFKDLGVSKDKIMMDYNQSIKPYYSNIVKELTANLALLQLKGMLSKKITEEELKQLEPRDINKILENIRKANDKAFELEYILQQDAKYRKEYLDPQNKVLEEAMKVMMKGFTSRISKALEDKR